MANYEQELLKRCGKAFKALTAYSYQIKMFHDGIVSDINLKFTPSDFLHLTSLEKLDGVWQMSYMDSGYTSDGRRLFKKNEKMLENIIKERFNFKTVETAVNFFDDTNESPERIENARQSGCVIRSELLSRLSALENLYIIINNSELDTENIQKLFALKVYKWDKTARHESRPHSSRINADYLFEFQKKYNSEKPYVDFFIVGNSESYNGMSIFQSGKTYSCDIEEERNKRNLPVRSVTDSKMEILSFIEIRTDPKTKQQTETIIMTKSDEYIQQCEKESKKTKEETAGKEILKAEKKKTESILANLKKNRMCQSPKQQREYNKIFNLLNTDGTKELLRALVKRLSSSKADAKDDRLSEKIGSEIEKINDIAENKGWNLSEFHILDNHDISFNGTLAITQNPLMKALTSLAERFRTFVQNIADKVQETLAGALKELPDADTTPSEQKPEHDEQNTESASASVPEKDITDDDEYIIRDVYSLFADNSIGTQGYENYMAMISADKLDFQIPITYETEQKNQEQEYDFLSDKAMPTEFKTKHSEHDDR